MVKNLKNEKKTSSLGETSLLRKEYSSDCNISLTKLNQRTLHCNFFITFLIVLIYLWNVKKKYMTFTKLIQIRLII